MVRAIPMPGDYVQADGERPCTNVFHFAIGDGKNQRVDEYATPVTFAKLAGLPIGYPEDGSHDEHEIS